MMRRRSEAGITSLELAIVVAIIAVLVLCFLLPRFERARERARATSCQSNLKQLATALHMYAYEHNGVFPPGPEPWLPQYPYMRNTQIVVCPSVQLPPDSETAVTTPSGTVVAVRSYGYSYVPGHANDGPPDGLLVADDEPRHVGGANVVFLSGETRLLSAEAWQDLGLAEESETRGDEE
ncbi:MAG: type II secretion system protein [Armatimonadota bacterium]